ncbi:MAG: Arylsulfatase [Alphaproteobacteria bacterium]|nr:MAG: Arylsulfatase [Alphaproteobacteria bacterium]
MPAIMSARLKIWLKRLGLLMALPMLTIILTIVYVSVKIATYEQRDDAAHMASKVDYLKSIARAAPENAPDLVVILFDDLGYGDVGFTGNQIIATPHMDALADKGMVLENYYAPAPVCSPSRAAMLTGRLPPRAGLTHVPFPSGTIFDRLNRFFGNPVRLPREEILLADILQAVGYETAMVGKWHMGDHAGSVPTQFGFQRFFGTYYSNDMNPFTLVRGTADKGEAISHAAPFDQTQLNRLYAEAAERFIAEAATDKPLFLYFAHNFPHVPLYAAPSEAGRSDAGLYGDVVQGLDDTVGRLIAALKQRGRFDNTLILITSDNGPWWEGRGVGRGRKGVSFEGGIRVPFIAYWPQQIKPARSAALAMGTDLLPTMLDELNVPPPPDRVLDGKSIAASLRGGPSPHEVLYHYAAGTLMAVRSATHKYRDRKAVAYPTDPVRLPIWQAHGPWLFDMRADPQEAYDISMQQADMAAQMKALMEAKNAEMKANPRGWK